MRDLVLAIFFWTLIPGGFGRENFPKWNALIATWCYDPTSDPNHCFYNIPRTVSEATEKGWVEVQSNTGCRNGGRFYGRRFIPKSRDVAISPLYDVNGIIAGLQLNNLKSELFAIPNRYKYAQVSTYLDHTILGQPVYSLTYYYVDPDLICSIGRTKSELDKEGTGTGLYFQNGPSPKHLIKIPLYRDTAIAEKWSDNQCVPTMGYHNYYDVPHMSDSNCSTIRPQFLLFTHNGELIGVGGTSVGNLTSPRFEHPDAFAVRTGLGINTPDCMIEISEYPRYSNVHMFFVSEPRQIGCGDKPYVQQVNHDGKDAYISPWALPNHRHPHRS